MVEEKHKAYGIIPVYAPALGLAGHVPPTMLKHQYAADCLNVRFKNGEVLKRTGYVDYGAGAITGVPLGFYRYQKWNGNEYPMLVTTTDIYVLEAGVWVSIVADLNGSVDTRFSMATIQNALVFANGYGVAKKWHDILAVGMPPWDTGFGTGVEVLRPNAAGTYTNIPYQEPDSGAHWEKVDDLQDSPDDSTTNVYTVGTSSEGNQQKDAYNLADSSGSGTINSVKAYFRCTGGPGAYQPKVQPFLRLNTTETAGTEIIPQYIGGYRTDSEVLARPGGGNWSWADIDALQVCIGLRVSGGGNVNCTQIYVEIDYTPLITWVTKDNPANASGTIDTVEIWAYSDLSDVEVATFFVVADNNLSTRDTHTIGSVTAGSKQTFTGLSLTAEEGDFLGIYCSDGCLGIETSGYSGVWHKAGDNIPCTDQTFTPLAGAIVSIYGTGVGVGNVGGASSYKPATLLPYANRLVMFNITEDSIPVPIRIRWSAAGTFETWTGTGSSFFDVTDGMGARIVGAELLGNYVGVYKDYSISLMDYVKGASIFAIDVHINNMGLAARSAIVNLHTLHVFLGWDNVYAWNGGWKLQEIGNPIKDELFGEINNSKIGRSFMLHCPREHEIHLFVPLGTDDYPTRFWTYRYELAEGEIKGVWSKGVIASVSGAGSITSGGVERALLGLPDGGIEHYDYEAVNDNGVKIDGWFETPDLPVSEEEYILEREMFNGFSAEAYGNTLTLSYSVDGGNSYTDMTAKTLQSTSLYKLEDWYFKKHGQQVRFKLRNNVTGETFRFRFYCVKVIPREAHK